MTSTTRIKLHRMKRGNGRAVWMKRWYDTNGKLCGETIGDCSEMSKRDAQAIVRKAQSDMDAGTVRRDRPMPMTLKQYRDQYEQFAKGSMTGSSMMLAMQAFKWAMDTLGTDIDVHSVDALAVARIRSAMTAAGSEPPTIHKVCAYLRSAFNRGMKLGMLHSNPFAGLETPEDATRAKEAVIRTPDEIAKLKAAAPNAWWRAMIGLLFTGLRRDEGLSLQWDRIDFDGGTVDIRSRKGGSFTVAGETYPVLAWKPKNRNGTRIVPVAADTMQALRQLRAESDGSPYVFLSLRRLAAIQRMQAAGKWGANSSLTADPMQAFQSLQRQVLGEDITPCTIHDCRKAFTTHASGVIPIQSLAKIVGDDAKTLMKYYMRPRDVDADAVRKLTDSGPALKLAG